MRRLLLISVGLAAGLPLRAAWTGDVTRSVEKGATLLGYQSASRDVENTQASGAGALTFKNRGLVLEQRQSLSPVAQLAIRLLPFTGRINLEGSSFNPHMAGGGIGFYLAPPEAFGPVHLGAAAIWDGAAGATQRPNVSPKRYDRAYTSEATLAAGASAQPLEFLRLYAGLAFVSYRARITLPGSRTNWKEDSPWGGFFGASLAAEKAWFLNAEVRAGGERAFGLFLGYTY